MIDGPITNNPFDDATIASVVGYMNREQSGSLLVIATASSTHPVASVAMTGFDGAGVDLTLSGAQGEFVIRVPWQHPISQRYEVRGQLLALLDDAIATLDDQP